MLCEKPLVLRRKLFNQSRFAEPESLGARNILIAVPMSLPTRAAARPVATHRASKGREAKMGNSSNAYSELSVRERNWSSFHELQDLGLIFGFFCEWMPDRFEATSGNVHRAVFEFHPSAAVGLHVSTNAVRVFCDEFLKSLLVYGTDRILCNGFKGSDNPFCRSHGTAVDVAGVFEVNAVGKASTARNWP